MLIIRREFTSVWKHRQRRAGIYFENARYRRIEFRQFFPPQLAVPVSSIATPRLKQSHAAPRPRDKCRVLSRRGVFITACPDCGFAPSLSLSLCIPIADYLPRDYREDIARVHAALPA